MVASHAGIVDSLCETCKSLDCSNPIQEREVSVIGVMKKMKLFMGPDPTLVIQCEGYIK